MRRPRRTAPLVEVHTNPRLAVEQLEDEGVTRWTVRGPAHTELTLDAQETLREDGHRIGWKTLPDQSIAHTGDITVHSSDGRTRVQVQMRYNPVAGEIGHGVAILVGSDAGHLMRADLVRLRDLVENGKRHRKPAAKSTAKPTTKPTTKAADN